MIIILF